MSRPAPPAIAPPLPGLHRYRMLVAYDGGSYRGFAANRGVATVEGALTRALGRVLGAEPALSCAGRTDAGVHGWGQVVSFDAEPIDDPGRLQRSLNAMCAPGVVIRSIAPAAEDFDARHSARARTYRYRVLNRAVPDPILHRTTWHVADPLDVAAMQHAGDHLLGEHDFSSFCRRRTIMVAGEHVEASLVRDVLSVEWRRAAVARRDGVVGGDDPLADVLELWITATAFCHQMVRSVTGTMVDVGRGRRDADEVPVILAARNRAAAAPVAPAQGLTLWHVTYDGAEDPHG